MTKYEENINKFNKYYSLYNNKLINAQTELEKILIFKELYQFVKNFSIYLGPSYINHSTYNYIRKIIMTLEDKYLNNYFITNTNPNYNYIQDNHLLSYQDDEYILHYIILKCRYYLHKIINIKDNFNKLDLTNYCNIACDYILNICNKLNIKGTKVKIIPGFSDKYKIYYGGGYHYFIVIDINNNNNKYLLDPTYSQFFLLKRNIIDRIGIINLSGCDAGIFMYMDKDRKLVADKILQDGFIKLDENTLKHYLDGFAISYRNGLYYENTQDYSYTTNYTSLDHEKFLKGLDSQINHEKISYLGYQRKPK